MNTWFVSRQSYWGVEDPYVVEIAGGGIDYANPDMLCEHYPGEGEEYTDPRKAVEAALAIAAAWKRDNPDLNISVAHGHTMGFTMPFEPEGERELRDWAQKAYEEMMAEKRSLEEEEQNG